MTASDPGRDAPPFEIAEIEAGDFEEIREIWETLRFWPHVGEGRRWFERALERNPGLFLAARARGRMIGTICGAWDGMRGWFYHFGVLPAFRRQGVGEALMTEVERRPDGLRTASAL